MPFDTRRGFTLIEIVAVVVILAIISAVAVSRMGADSTRLRVELNDLKAALRYAQQMAIAADDTVTFSLTVSATGYAISRTGGSGNQPLLPGESGSSHPFSGVAGPVSAVTFTFNDWGSLTTGTTAVTLTQTQGGSGSKTVNIIPETGYAYES